MYKNYLATLKITKTPKIILIQPQQELSLCKKNIFKTSIVFQLGGKETYSFLFYFLH